MLDGLPIERGMNPPTKKPKIKLQKMNITENTPINATLLTGESRPVLRGSKFTVRKNGLYLKRTMMGFLSKKEWVENIENATVVTGYCAADILLKTATQQGFNSDNTGTPELVCVEEL
jgi:hypothetical protein